MTDFHTSLDRALGDTWDNVGYAFPLRFMAGVDQDCVLVQTDGSGPPATMTLETCELDPELMALLFGQPVIPLCDHQLPARGQE